MALETGNRIQDLVPTNPVGATDFVSQGDDQIRLVKVCVQGSLPNLGAGQVTASAEELSILDGATLTTSELNILDGVTSSTAELNILDGVTSSTAELNILDGVTKTAAEINDLARKSVDNAFSAVQTFSVRVELASGTVGAPTFTFTGDADTGIYRRSANDIGVAVGGALAAVFSATQTTFPLAPIYCVDGSAAAPGIGFNNDIDTGIYRVGTNQIGFATAGVARWAINATGLLEALGTTQIINSSGSVGAPAYSFASDPDTGFYGVGAGQTRYSADGVLSWIVRADGSFFLDGTAANPGISFIQDADTGFYRIAADQVGFSEGGSGFRVGFRNIPQNSQSANYTCVAADTGKHILHPSGGGSGDTFTIPANASVAYDIGTVLTFINRDSNSVSIAITSDTLVFAGSTTTGTRTLAQNGVATAIKVESTTWIISGTGLS